MKPTVETLIEKITALPWTTGSLMTRVEVLPPGWNMPMLVADCHGRHAPEAEDERVANAAYLVHAANNFPKLLEALTRISNGNDVARMSEWANDALTQAREVKG